MNSEKWKTKVKSGNDFHFSLIFHSIFQFAVKSENQKWKVKNQYDLLYVGIST